MAMNGLFVSFFKKPRRHSRCTSSEIAEILLHSSAFSDRAIITSKHKQPKSYGRDHLDV